MKNLLASARLEIMLLREQNQIMKAQLSIVDVFAVALGLKPKDQEMTIDVAWQLQQKIEELEKAER